MYISAAITAVLACSTVAALPFPSSPLSSPRDDDFALQLLNSHKRVLAPDVEKLKFLEKSEGLDSKKKRGWFDLIAIPDLAMRIKQWKEDGHP